MPYEKTSGLGVSNQYGPRTSGGVKGPDVSSGVLNQHVWFYDADTTLDDEFKIPAGSMIVDVQKPANVTAVTVGGTAVQAATWAAPIVAGGDVLATGATTGNKIVITYQKVVGALAGA